MLAAFFLSSAWAQTQGLSWATQDIRLLRPPDLGESIVVAIVDTGADPLHPLLKGRLWTNPGESGLDSQHRDRSKNGIDDDKNGYIDDVHGWDFVKNEGTCRDAHGHGTHIAGIVATHAPHAQLMILRYYDVDLPPGATIDHTVAAFRYATKMGAKIINYSAGGSAFNSKEFQALKETEAKGILVVAAAGNEGANSALEPYFPANYPLNNILAIAAHGPHHRLLKSSNYGLKTVDLSAPGENIVSALPGGTFGSMTGTSQATAHATAVAALTWAKHASLRHPHALIEHLLATGIMEEKLKNLVRSGARLDAYQALGMAPEDPSSFLIHREPTGRNPSSPEGVWQLADRLSRVLSRPTPAPTFTSP